jgi:hypothetical protein
MRTSAHCDRCGGSPAPNEGYCVVGPFVLRNLSFCRACAQLRSVSPDPTGSFAGMWPVDFSVLRESIKAPRHAGSPETEFVGPRIVEVALHFGQAVPEDIIRWADSNGHALPD